MNTTYTLRYNDETDRLIRTSTIPCNDVQEAVRISALTMQKPYAALEISLGNNIVWSGSKERVDVWASSLEPDLASEQPSPVLSMMAARARALSPAMACLAVNSERDPPRRETPLGTVLPFRF
jgi:hypothetical protein